MSAAVIGIRRRDPAVIAARAHHVLDAVARTHRTWPRAGRLPMNECFVALDGAIGAYNAAGDEERQETAETAGFAMAVLLISVAIYLGKAAADQMMRDAAEVAA